MSLPAWGAWIEIHLLVSHVNIIACRSPHGGRGLKYKFTVKVFFYTKSLPAWGAWIEI